MQVYTVDLDIYVNRGNLAHNCQLQKIFICGHFIARYMLSV